MIEAPPRRLRRWLALVLVVAGCGGDEAAPRLGRPADLDALGRALADAGERPPAARPAALARAVLAQCGSDCACLGSAIDDGGAPSCPAANPSVPVAWPPIELAGRYLAQELARADRRHRDDLRAAIEGLEVPVARVDPARVTLPAATSTRTLSPAATLTVVAADGTTATQPMPIARFGAQGARIVDAAPPPPPAAPIADPDALGTFGAPGHRSYTVASQQLLGASSVARVDERPLADEPIVAADATAPAAAVVVALAAGGALAVTGPDAPRELTVAFLPRDDGAPADAELVRTAAAWVLQPAGGDVTTWPIDDAGQADPRFLAALDDATPPRGLVAIGVQDGTTATMIAAMELAVRAGATRLRVIAGTEGLGHGRYGTLVGGRTGFGPGGLGATPPSGPRVQLGQPQHVGDLDKAIIRRYVKRNLNKITYCYEKELLAKPQLAGIVSTSFVIQPDGRVRDMNASGVDPAVAACVAHVLEAIEFPHPQGGGPVYVNYPFRFATAGP